MELEGDNPAPRPPAAPARVTAQTLQVTPENVVALAALFRDCANLLEDQVVAAEHDLRLAEPWMRDPVSEWAMARFNDYFVDGEHSLANVLKDQYDQYKAMRDALVAAGQRYGLTEELIAAGFTDLAPA